MELINPRSPRYNDAGSIILTMTISDTGEDVEYYAVSHDVEEFGRNLYQQAINGIFGVVSPYVPPVTAPDDLIKQEIVALESQQTPRRMREAALGIDNGWLVGIEAQIEALRAQLGGS